MRKLGLAAFAMLAGSALSVAAVEVRVAMARQGADEALPDGGAAGRDDALGLQATLTCEHAAAPGRVRCEVEARVDAGTSISWGDIVLRRVPPFATALRGRVGPHDASVREPGLWRWPFALVAREKGAGQVEGQVRVVVCKDKACLPRDVPVTGRVEVGP